MISYIKGELTEVFEDTVVVETNGIGYNIRVPARCLTACRLSAVLYGFIHIYMSKKMR